MAARIEDYALVGDGQTAALISRDGSVDWLCWPRFDSPACFAALLGAPEHGRWLIAPLQPVSKCTRRYAGDTLILETELETESGRVKLIEFMPPRGVASDLVRIVAGMAGRVRLRTELVVRFDYGTVVPWVTQFRSDAHRSNADADQGHAASTSGTATEWHAVAGPDQLTVRTPIELRGIDHKTVGEFEVGAGERVAFVMTYSPSHLPIPEGVDVERALRDTHAFWSEWARRCQFTGPWREAVVRSLITLKALIYEPTGGIVAAPTTSLPEQPGGHRNWDYRYCWLRDAAFTLLALMNAGYFEEADAWRAWLVRAFGGAPAKAQIMYGLGGERRLMEWELSHLPGYEQSLPVRIGNAAAQQLQLDVYGEVADALHLARQGGLAAADSDWPVQRVLTHHLEKIWSQPDEGIWEVRGPRRHFTHSKVMAWVAVDRAIGAMETRHLPGPLDRWRALRRRIHDDVCTRGFNERLGSFVQAYDSDLLDASLLLIPLVGFLPMSDARVLGTLEAIGKHLRAEGLIRRYHTTQTQDGLPAGEGAFLACSFWYVDNLVLAGRRDEAREMFEHLLTLRNDVGLLAEEYDPRTRRQLGNFPQAFSHVSLVSSAYNLSAHDEAKPCKQRARSQDRPAPPHAQA